MGRPPAVHRCIKPTKHHTAAWRRVASGLGQRRCAFTGPAARLPGQGRWLNPPGAGPRQPYAVLQRPHIPVTARPLPDYARVSPGRARYGSLASYALPSRAPSPLAQRHSNGPGRTDATVVTWSRGRYESCCAAKDVQAAVGQWQSVVTRSGDKGAAAQRCLDRLRMASLPLYTQLFGPISREPEGTLDTYTRTHAHAHAHAHTHTHT